MCNDKIDLDNYYRHVSTIAQLSLCSFETFVFVNYQFDQTMMKVVKNGFHAHAIYSSIIIKPTAYQRIQQYW